MEFIESEKNVKFKYWLSLLTSKGLKKSEDFLMSGINWTKECIEKRTSEVCYILFSEETQLDALPKKENIKSIQLSKKLFNELDIYGTKQAILVLKKPKIEQWNPETPTENGLQILCPLGEPSNLGSLLRNASAFGVNKIILLKEASSPFHPKSVRAAAGNLWDVSLFEGPSIHDLQDLNIELVALDMKGEKLSQFQWPKKAYLLIGEEGPGIPKNLTNHIKKISIPMEPNTESLNATQAASIALYDHYIKTN